MRHPLVAVLCVLVAGASNAQAPAAVGDRRPTVGEAARPLSRVEWLREPAVPTFAADHVYVVDIWAPWCTPCLAGMARLSELQREKAGHGLVVVGLVAPDAYGSTRETVLRALHDQGDRLAYSIAWDADRSSFDWWMSIERDRGWPWSFLVDRSGRIAYSGHPDGMLPVLERVLDGTYDLAAAADAYRLRLDARADAAEAAAALAAHDGRSARDAFDRALSRDPTIATPLVGKVYRGLAESTSTRAEAVSFGRAIAALLRDNSKVMMDLAAAIAGSSPPLGEAELELATACAQRAVALTRGTDPGSLSVLARSHWLAGRRAAAIADQRRAVRLVPEAYRASFEKDLKTYEDDDAERQ